MKHIYYTLLFVLLASILNVAEAQITFTESFFLDRFGEAETSILYELDDSMDLTSIINATGENQTWDFSAFVITDTFSVTQNYIELPGDVPGASLFPDSDFAIELTADTVDAEDFAFYLFSSLENGFFQSDGSLTIGDLDEDGTPDTLMTTFSPSSLENPIPLSYEDAWEDSTSSILTIQGMDFPAFSAQLSTSTVDGWGTLITPVGSFQALRITTDFYDRDLLGGTVTMSHTDVEFISLEGVQASIFIDTDGSSPDASFSILDDGSMSGTSVEDDEGLPSAFQLSQNYPNPFNPSTTISYTVPATSDVKLVVYTLMGQEVATLVNATQGVGTYEVSFDASSIASGLYLYRLEAGSFSEARLMSLVK